MKIKYICSWCGTFAADHRVDIYDNGTTLTCNKCKEVTVVDLDRPENRTTRYEAIKDARAAGFAEGLEAAAVTAKKYECRKQKVCCKLQLWSVGQEIRALMPKKEVT